MDQHYSYHKTVATKMPHCPIANVGPFLQQDRISFFFFFNLFMLLIIIVIVVLACLFAV